MTLQEQSKKLTLPLLINSSILFNWKPDILSVLIWIQTVWRSYQQKTKLAASKERVNRILFGYSTIYLKGLQVGISLLQFLFELMSTIFQP